MFATAVRTLASVAGRRLSTGSAAPVAVAMFGAPGSGKGTIAEWLVRDFALGHLSTGDLIRDALSDADFLATDKGKAIKATIDAGNLVGDDIILDLLKPKIDVAAAPRIILDGFPRTLVQAKMLDAIRPVDVVLEVDVPAEEIVRRLSGRRVHPGSGRIYHVSFNPPKEEGKDDETGEPLVQRDDDKEEVILHRLEIFNDQKQPVLDYYASLDKVISVSGTESKVIYPAMRDRLIATGLV
ncbi:adenylate kinase [Thecamonas trahens ATCC 50062]|uniref:Adenylate kinase n=1 Tax=Thecamonas trahens ATCC 50062 TaxID=461836 RepID=A0A0L0DW58_THETB|nr:adenylate kinase [Thecamonas trahens ATCC 50062]KNC56412.1 adenylate kinase [Thecamonas trahens ATCC 50062]|eukprot:XP_013760925.1 adenylate kinase [Thecamonas trahens ATCC 50062]